MKVHTLDIDSGERDPTIYEYSNNYSVTLKTPLYNVTKLEVVSIRLPRPRVFNHFNNKFTIHDDFGTYDVAIDPLDTNFSSDSISETGLATYLQNTAIPASGCDTVDKVVYTYNHYEFSNLAATNEFHIDFYNGVDGFTSNVMNRTTPNQFFGLNTSNVASSSSVVSGGRAGVGVAPKSFVLKISTGSDDFNQDSYTATPFYTGIFLNTETDVTYSTFQEYYTFYGNDDSFVHEFNNGPQREISNLKFEWYYKENNKLIPLDFMNRDHAIKLRIHGSTDKLVSLPQNHPDVIHEEPNKNDTPINVPDIMDNVYNWKEYIYIGLILVIGLAIMSFMKKKPKLSE
jgi:hypothetical protein